MGYYTYYELTVRDANKGYIDEALEAQLTQEIFYDWYAADEKIPTRFLDVIGYDSLKWYDHDKDMTRVAENHPDLYFILEGRGEEEDDIWTKVYHGKYYREQYVQIIYPDTEDMIDEVEYEANHDEA